MDKMNIKIISVGKLKEKYLVQGINEYVKRLGAYAKIELIEVADEKAPENLSPAEMIQIKDKEADRILAKIKEQEYKAITAGNSAMQSAMSIIKGDADKRAMFDAAMDAIATDVSQKVGEMEEFMSLSENFMQSIDLQNGVFEEKGMAMLEKWEKEGVSLLLGDSKQKLIKEMETEEIMDLEHPVQEPEKLTRSGYQYDTFFD